MRAKHMRPRRTAASRKQAGYALLMAVFMVASLLLFASMVAPNVLTEGRREREQEVEWRGKQYVRAIRLFYQKNGRYPQDLDELKKANQAGTYFLRKSYTDLDNPSDGSWRPIYVSQSGQLIGSVRYHSLQEMALKLGQQVNPAMLNGALNGQQGSQQQGGAGAQSGQNSNAGAQAGNTGASNDPSQSAQSGQNGQNGQTQPGQAPPPPQGQAGPTQGQSSSGFGFSGFGQSGLSSGSAGSGFGSSTQPQSLAPLEPVSGPVLGGSLIGVGGKIKMPSLLIWQGGKQDYEWEFIYNPLTNSTVTISGTGVASGAPGTGTGTGTSGTTNQSPFAPTSPMGGSGTGAGNPGTPGLPPSTSSPNF